jgi:hypothetical protein
VTGPATAGDPTAAVGAVARTVLTRPALWGTATAALLRLARPGWWRRRPFLPLPDPALWAFRMETAYGSTTAVPTGSDVVAYLEWCRSEADHRDRSGGRRTATSHPVVLGPERSG